MFSVQSFVLVCAPMGLKVKSVHKKNELRTGFRPSPEWQTNTVFGGTRFCASAQQSHAATTKRGPPR